MYRKVAPVDNPKITSTDPNHFPNTNPANKRIGLPKPNISVQKTVNMKNKILED